MSSSPFSPLPPLLPHLVSIHPPIANFVLHILFNSFYSFLGVQISRRTCCVSKRKYSTHPLIYTHLNTLNITGTVTKKWGGDFVGWCSLSLAGKWRAHEQEWRRGDGGRRWWWDEQWTCFIFSSHHVQKSRVDDFLFAMFAVDVRWFLRSSKVAIHAADVRSLGRTIETSFSTCELWWSSNFL